MFQKNIQREMDCSLVADRFRGIPLPPANSTLAAEQVAAWKNALAQNSAVTKEGCWKHQGAQRDGYGVATKEGLLAHEIALALRLGRVLTKNERAKHDPGCTKSAGKLCCHPLHLSLVVAVQQTGHVDREGDPIRDDDWIQFLPSTTELEANWVAVVKAKLNACLVENIKGCWVPQDQPGSDGRLELRISPYGKGRGPRLAKTLQLGRPLGTKERVAHLEDLCATHLHGPCCRPDHLALESEEKRENLIKRKNKAPHHPGKRVYAPRPVVADKLSDSDYLAELGAAGRARFLHRQIENIEPGNRVPLPNPALVEGLQGDCWIWRQGRSAQLPYGRVYLGKTSESRQVPAPSAFYAWTTGSYPLIIPSAICGTPFCTRPAHLLPNPTDTQRQTIEALVRRFQEAEEDIGRIEPTQRLREWIAKYIQREGCYFLQ